MVISAGRTFRRSTLYTCTVVSCQNKQTIYSTLWAERSCKDWFSRLEVYERSVKDSFVGVLSSFNAGNSHSSLCKDNLEMLY